MLDNVSTISGATAVGVQNVENIIAFANDVRKMYRYCVKVDSALATL